MPAAPVRIALAALLAFGTAACGARTTLSSVWMAPGYTKTFHRMLVIGVGRTETGRRSFEDHFAAALRERGVEATPSYTALPADRKLTEEEIGRAVRQREIGGVLVTRLVGVDEKQEYVPPTISYYGGYHRHGGLYGYYGGAYDVVTTPGYWRSVTIVRLETHLYDASTGALVWGARSETFEPASTDAIIESVTDKILSQLAEDALLPPR